MFDFWPFTNFHQLNLDWIIKVIKDFQAQYTGLEETIENGEQSINDAAETGVASVEAETTAGIQAIRNLISIAPTRNYIFIGDSYGTRVNSANLNYYEYLKALGIVNADNSYFNAAPGAGFVHPDPNNTFLALLTAVQVEDPEKITDIYIECGANDNFRDFADIITAMNSFRTYANNRFPLARLWLFACGLTMKPDAFVTRANSTLMAFRQGARQGYNYVMNSESVLYNTAYLEPDRCHPNANGVNAITYALAMTIYNGYCTNKNQVYANQANAAISVTGAVTPSGAIVGSSSVGLRSFANDNIITLAQYDNIYMAFNLNGVTLDPSNRIVITMDNITGLPTDGLVRTCTIRNAAADDTHEVTGTYEFGYDENTSKYTITIRPRGAITTGTGNNVIQVYLTDNILV